MCKPAEDTWQTIEESGWPATSAIFQAYKAFHNAHPRKAADLRVVDAIAGFSVALQLFGDYAPPVAFRNVWQ